VFIKTACVSHRAAGSEHRDCGGFGIAWVPVGFARAWEVGEYCASGRTAPGFGSLTCGIAGGKMLCTLPGPTLGGQMRSTAFLCGVVAVALNACATSTAPGAIGVTRPQLMLVSSDAVNAQAAAFYSRATATARSTGKLLNSDDAKVRRVRQVAGMLINEVSIYRPDAASWAWEVNVVDVSAVNASCLPGGKIVVNTGLLSRLEVTDDELAAVLGHEIAHALREHGREKVSQGVLSNAVVQGVANSGARHANSAAALADLGTGLFFRLPYSRAMELEADVMGLELMARAGFDPRGAPALMKKMERLSPGGVEFFQTHPNSDHRATDLAAAMPKVMALFDAAPKKAPVGMQTAVTAERTTIALPATGLVAPPAGSFVASPGIARPIINARSVELGAPTTVVEPSGQDAYMAEKLSRESKCGTEKQASLVGKGPGYESYSFACSNGETLIVRCEYGACRALK
jgi:Zn-dependent protease with chaperone function